MTGIRGADALVGETLNGRYKLLEELATVQPDGERRSRTGCYHAVDTKNGDKAVFVKAVDFRHEDHAGDVDRLQNMVQEFVNEREIASRCKTLSRVVSILDHDKAKIFGNIVHYLVYDFEKNRSRSPIPAHQTPVERVKTLHGIAAALRQLHTNGIAHHDLSFRNTVQGNACGRTKICDFGSASFVRSSGSVPHDEYPVIGAVDVAPPEAQYGYKPLDSRVRHFAYDCYSLGSLLFRCFLNREYSLFEDWHSFSFSVLCFLPEGQQPNQWCQYGEYAELIPILREASIKVVNDAIVGPTPEIEQDVKKAVLALCDPDPLRRGVHGLRRTNGNPYSLEKFVSFFDRLSRSCEVALAVGKARQES
ncbi:MAG: hypothetical protein DHS20C11_13280 [Lysobacteraceae bacterium]|nr:MAG: hypothetical protein DHS20C11_13280 [Xanthomonadaceae bacterium]